MSVQENYILFELAGAAYAIRSAEVLHIEMIEHVTRVPHSAQAVEGVVFSRGQVIPAIDLRTRFGLPRQDATPRSRLIFLKSEGRTVAIIVDSAREFRSFPSEAIRPIDETLHGVRGNYLKGVFSHGDRLILILDLAAVLALDAFPTHPLETARTS
ncbi:MAG TPA: chemotaxis protein CheW [Opitutaceae bacterium]|jgi:purine-binding chemotaxis protein CheW